MHQSDEEPEEGTYNEVTYEPYNEEVEQGGPTKRDAMRVIEDLGTIRKYESDLTAGKWNSRSQVTIGDLIYSYRVGD